MRVIQLPSEQKEARSLFSILYTAAFQGEGAKSHAQARSLAKLQDVLEAATHEEQENDPSTGQSVKTRVLNDGVTEIRLEDAHHELLKERIYGANIPWLAAAARRVSSAYDIVCEAKDAKPGPQKVEDVA